MVWITSLVIFSTIFFIIYRWINKRYQFFETHGFPYEIPIFPFGNLKGAGTEYHANDIFHKLYKKLKGKAPACGIYFFFTPNVMITDLDLVKDILIRDFDCFHNRGTYFNKRDDPLSANLFTLENNEWRHMRAKITPTFTSGKMKLMFNAIVDVSNHMIEKLKTDADLEMLDVRDVFIKYSIDVIGNVAFGLELNALSDENSQFHVMARKIFVPSKLFFMRAFFLTSFQKLGRFLKMKFFPAEVSDFFMSVIKETVEYRIQNKVERNDFLDMLLKMHTTDGDKLSFEELAAQCFLFFVAGFETSSTASSFVLYNLAIHNDIQEKLRGEIKSVLARHDNQLSYDSLNDMKYLQMFVDESLRMYTPVAQVLRVPSRDYKISNSNLVIPKGVLTGIVTSAIHMDPEYYPEPEKFDPERFSEENKAKRHPMAFLPFGDGPRNCIGLRFGLMQTKIAIIQLLLNFRIHPNSRTQIPMKYDPSAPTLAPLGGMWLRFENIL